MLKSLRRAALRHQGLSEARPFGKGKQATLHALQRLGYIQIDTISVIERAHHHTLWNRVPDYRPQYLHQLIHDRAAFEYWFHAASYLPIQDFRFALPRMAMVRRGGLRYYNNIDTKSLRYVHDRIRAEGPLKARDFESPPRKTAQWWNWKPTKKALEKLFMQGDLMITERAGMEKVYDLTERVLPGHINTNEPNLEEVCEHLLNRSVLANGFTTIKQVTHLRPGSDLRKAMGRIIQQQLEEQRIVKFEIDGMPTIYADPQLLNQTIRAPKPKVRLLSPFDNAIIHRDRAQQLFGFDYRLECYTPADKRRYGYFCLPILYREALVGQVDCKAHRNNCELELVHLHLGENLDQQLEPFLAHFAKSVQNFARFNGCDAVRLTKVSPRKLTRAVKNSLASV